jgi:hypothetical protein
VSFRGVGFAKPHFDPEFYGDAAAAPDVLKKLGLVLLGFVAMRSPRAILKLLFAYTTG